MKDRKIWLARRPRVQLAFDYYGLCRTEKQAIDYADGSPAIVIRTFCTEEFEEVTGMELEPGCYCPVRIDLINLI